MKGLLFSILVILIFSTTAIQQSFAQSDNYDEYVDSVTSKTKANLDVLWNGYYHGSYWDDPKLQYEEYLGSAAQGYLNRASEKETFAFYELERIHEKYWDTAHSNFGDQYILSVMHELDNDLLDVQKAIDAVPDLIKAAEKAESRHRLWLVEQEKTHEIKEKESEIEQLEKEKNNAIVFQKISNLKSNAYEKLNSLKDSLSTSQSILEQTIPTSDESREKINQAWNLIKENKQTLEKFEMQISKADKSGDMDFIENAYVFDNIPNSSIFEENLNDVSNLNTESEKLESRFCFLFWCW
jgi:hypothetical protein